MTDDLEAGMTVQADAEYNNHDEWTSPIEVEDDPHWETTYGTTIQGSYVDNNDWTLTAALAIYRAGNYTISVRIDGVEVIKSASNILRVVPSSYSAENFALKAIPAYFYAGFEYQLLIQGRDIYKNNIKDMLGELIGAT